MEFPGEKLVIRLWDTVERSIGGLLRPQQIRRVGKAHIDVLREKKLALAQLERECEEVRSGRKLLTSNGQIAEVTDPHSEDSSDVDTTPIMFADTAYKKMVLREMQSEARVGRALLAAAAELENDPQEPPDRYVDEDWLMRWRDSASQVSVEELQELWGRVLAGEVKSPGTFSLRTLEFLRSLSIEEANQIAQLAPFVIDENFVFKGDGSPLESEGITLGLILGLCDLGIVHPERDLLEYTIKSAASDKFKLGLFASERVLVISHDNPKKELAVPAYRLTSLGRAVLKVGAFVPNESYLRHFGVTIREKGFKVELARFQRLTESKVRYFDSEEL